MYGPFTAHEARPPVASRAGHVLLITWVYVSVVVVGYTYSSQLTASLTVQEVSPPFSSLQQLVSQDTYTWGVMGGTGLHSVLQAGGMVPHPFQRRKAAVELHVQFSWFLSPPHLLLRPFVFLLLLPSSSSSSSSSSSPSSSSFFFFFSFFFGFIFLFLIFISFFSSFP